MLRPTRYALLAWLGMLSLAAAQTDPAPLTPPSDGAGPDALPQQSAPPQPLPHYHALPPQPVALPPADGPWQYVPPVADAAPPSLAPAPSAGEPSDDQVKHLLKAAEHLEAAGLAEQAARLRLEARQRSLSPLLAAKLAQLRSLQAEVDRLKTVVGCDRTVDLKLKIAEVSREKVIQLRGHINPEGAISSLVQCAHSSSKKVPVVVASDEDSFGWQRDWKALKEARALTVISAPSIVTISGQAAKCSVGGLRPIAVPAGKDQTAIEIKHLGTSVELTPHVLSDRRLRLELRCRTDTLDDSSDRKIGGQIVPGMRIREIDAAVEMTVGQTAVLACIEPDESHETAVRQTSAIAKPQGKDDNVTLVFVTLNEIAEKVQRASPSPLAEKPEPSWWERWWRK